jgi:HK97 gp10 family phage protein
LSAVVEVEVLHAKELVEALRVSFLDSVNRKVDDAISTVGNRMLDTALRLVPVRTGYLRSTIRFERMEKWAFRLFACAPYAPYVEWGTMRMAARLFMTHAVEMHRVEMQEEVENAIGLAIEEGLR